MMEIKLLDGGFGSQIGKRINRTIDDDVLWSARLLSTNKAEVINTHLDFLQAGANIISTNTYQASIDGFVKYLNLSERESYDLIKEAVGLARKAISIYKSRNNIENTNILVAGSVGPYGAFLHDGSEYTGNYKDSISSSILNEWHKPRISALIEGGIDLLAFETIPCEKEAVVLLSILKEFPNMKAWLSFNCKDGKSIASGEAFQETLKKCYKMNPNQLLAVGANCIAPEIVEQLFCDINMGEGNPMPLLVYPNSGEFYNKEVGWHGGVKGKSVENYVESWLNMGITWIGGCCRMYAENISKIGEVILKWRMQHSK
ncbi:Homocysteine S-methyltransferase [Popillia japonica]|uniref:Homocysteine S-methyltransferase n=1 Tax=Popillia japonica TaxID=7064 RepID=A0AAW1LVG7_POPJA